MERNGSTRIISVSSGKGGVGKTNISVNLALALAEKGFRTCLFDADLGLANINILLGLDPEYTIEHLISGKNDLTDIIIRDFNGIDIISGSSGVEKIANLHGADIQRLSASLGRLSDYDFLIFDTSAGIGSPVIAFCMAATEVLLVITPEPTSMTDAYALLKVLSLNGFMGVVKIVVNQCRTIDHVKEIYNSFKKVVTHFLKVEVPLTGFILKDSKLEESVKKQNPFLLLYPNSNATKCMKYMAKILASKEPGKELNQGMEAFWDKCFSIMNNRLILSEEDKRDHEKNRNHNEVRDHKDGEPSSKNIEILSEATDVSISSNDKETISSDSIKIHAPARGLMDIQLPKKSIMQNIPDDGDGEILNLMGQLVRSMQDISGELRDIKTSLKNGHSFSVFKEDNHEPSNSDSTDNDAYILDYEEFLKNRI